VKSHIFILPLAAAALLVVGTAQPSGQAAPQGRRAEKDTLPGAEAVKALVTRVTKKGWVPPRTPWGDPDISGNFTTKDEYTTPFERPKEWDGRQMEDITPAEFAKAKVEWQKTSAGRLNAPPAGAAKDAPPLRSTKFFTTMEGKNSRQWMVLDPSDGKVPALTPEARGRLIRGGAAADSYADRPLSERCIMYGELRTPGPYGNSQGILQTPNYVVIEQEQIHEARIVPIDGRPQPSAAIRNWFGVARGFWDGNTLVVVSTGFRPEMDFRGSSLGNARIIERFTRTAPDRVEWSMTLDDSTTWTKPWTWSLPMRQDDSEQIYEFACHEGNQGVEGILRNARAADKSGASQRRPAAGAPGVE
jgi:hypothetical protein